MANISQEVDIELLEKKPDGSYVKKNPTTKAGIVKFEDGSTVEEHKVEKATSNTLGHIKLSDIPKPYVTDDVTGEQYKWGVENGIIFLERVDRQ